MFKINSKDNRRLQLMFVSRSRKNSAKYLR